MWGTFANDDELDHQPEKVTLEDQKGNSENTSSKNI